jgi:hypothetical protein
MSEDDGQLKQSTQLQPASDTPGDKATALSQVEERIAKAHSPQEALFWTQIRGEIVKQNEIIQAGKQRRFIQQIQIWQRIGVSVAALTIGLVFFSLGSTEVGLLVIGVFLYELAPELKQEAFVAEAEKKMLSRPAQFEGFRSISVGLILASVTAGLLVEVGKTETKFGMDLVLITISGMTTIAALSAFNGFLERDRRTIATADDITFNECLASKSILQIPNELNFEQQERTLDSQVSSWFLSFTQLIGTDNSLALAKLRIEIERELRRVADERDIDIFTQPIGILELVEKLVAKEVIPCVWVDALKEIKKNCDRAIHGVEISDDLANSIVRVGGQMLEKLRLLHLEK